MDFLGAMKRVLDGGRITREAWDNTGIYVSLQSGLVTIRMEDKKFHPWTISEVDVYAHDWDDAVAGHA